MEQWPDTFIDWSASITVEEIEMRTLWRFQSFPFLWDNPEKDCRRIAATLGEIGRQRAFQLAGDLCNVRQYFRSVQAYKRWLQTVAYREAIRAAFLHPDIEVLLGQFTAEQAMTLRYLYIDQMTDAQLATASGTVPVSKARSQGVAAYRDLCGLLRTQGWAREDMAPFPAYPTFPNAL